MTLLKEQLVLYPSPATPRELVNRTSTFVDNMRLPVHRWFRYSAGFSAQWVKEIISAAKKDSSVTVFDPFAGSGTTLLAAQECGVPSWGVEAHPFVVRIARAKLLWHEDAEGFFDFAQELLNKAQRDGGSQEGYSSLIQRCYPENILVDLDAIRRAWLSAADGSSASELSWLALTSSLRDCSPVGTSQMELIQPKKRKQNFVPPFDAFSSRTSLMLKDMRLFQNVVRYVEAGISKADARLSNCIDDSSISLVITSPPYVNNFDYADATRLEMTFWGEIDGWGELQHKVRQYLIRSCSQHMSSQNEGLDGLLEQTVSVPIVTELRSACERLAKERLLHGGKKNYHLMVAAYFSDMAKVWLTLRRVCTRASRVCFVIGDSAPYGVYLPVHKWLGELALAAGFKSYEFEKTRDRNTKWKNRKHRVPLCEGRLWVEG